MVTLSNVFLCLAFSALSLGNPSNKKPLSQSPSTAKAVYFLTNQQPNAVVSLKDNSDGTLTDGSITMTGGDGVTGMPLANGSPLGKGTLFGQGAVTVAGQVSKQLPGPWTYLQTWNADWTFLMATVTLCRQRRIEHLVDVSD